jgi:hypothetical protein
MMEQHESGRSILLLLLPLQKMESKAIMCKWFRLGSIHPSIHPSIFLKSGTKVLRNGVGSERGGAVVVV